MLSVLLALDNADYIAGPWALIGVVASIAAAVIVSNKGHSGFQIFAHLVLGVFCCWPWSLVSALVAKDLTKEREYEAANKHRADLAWRTQNLERQVARVSDLPPHAVPAGFVRCPQCASVCNSDLMQCWNCAYEFTASGPHTETVVAPEIPHDTDKLKKQPVKPISVDTRGSTEKELRIECRACGKRYSGAKGKIQSLRTCPKCGAAPFDYRQLPKSSS